MKYSEPVTDGVALGFRIEGEKVSVKRAKGAEEQCRQTGKKGPPYLTIGSNIY